MEPVAMAGIPRLRAYRGPAILSYGFRPFFLFGAAYAGLAILVWLPLFQGQIDLASTFTARDWHVHEMLYGFVPAIVTGFLLTAIPNWTGRLPLQGLPLLTLFGAWVAGRLAVTLSSSIGWAAAAAIDCAFLLLVAAAAAREIAAGRNWRNLKVVAVVGVLAAGNLIFHFEAHFRGSADYAVRLGIGAVILLISLVGGRVVPSFTHNWLARQAPGRMPSPFGRFDVMVVAVSAAALALWIAAPLDSITGVVLIGAGLIQLVRLLRWAGERTIRDRLVLVLHIGYAFV
ncbi:MAG TPA: NnrS family protein, partial [Pirellulales bacterium]|nr:NnrS family protein [Pirellulales bacterium]